MIDSFTEVKAHLTDDTTERQIFHGLLLLAIKKRGIRHTI